METQTKQRRGFAAISKSLQREIASRGGKRAHELGVAHKWDSKTGHAASLKSKHVQEARRKNVERSN